jgi:hypothetical protein
MDGFTVKFYGWVVLILIRILLVEMFFKFKYSRA